MHVPVELIIYSIYLYIYVYSIRTVFKIRKVDILNQELILPGFPESRKQCPRRNVLERRNPCGIYPVAIWHMQKAHTLSVWRLWPTLDTPLLL